MTFASLNTAFFRNLADGKTDTQSRDVFLVGENGQGKSNFLEALYFSAYASSFRGSRDADLPRLPDSGNTANGGTAVFSESVPVPAESCAVQAGLSGSVHGMVSVRLEKGKKTISLDGKILGDRKELLQVIPCIIFCHEDMDFVSGPPESRRRFFDQVQSLYDPVYLDDLRRCRRLLRTKNTLLRGGTLPDGTGSGDGEARERGWGASRDAVLDSLDIQLASAGLALMRKREEAAVRFSALFGPLYGEVSGIGGISVRYVSSWHGTTEEEIVKFLAGKREKEKVQGISLSGPHRDRYLFLRNGSPFSARASTGQRRLLALLLRTAQAVSFSRETGKNPVLLLDDVLLELDPEKRRRFLALMPDYEQAFYTFLPEEPYGRYRRDDTLVYEVRNGVLRAV